MTHTGEPDTPTSGNRLAQSNSPYLLQHADNPVDWHPWGEEAFEIAEREDKPIFLSIGYATCHWCHVMEHESFEDLEVAALMNEAFVNIKVDREERPDIDQVYMAVCQMMTGGGGWPLTIIMTPDKEPFFAGTYIPRQSRYGRVGMLDLIPRVSEVWRSDRDKVAATTRQITTALKRTEARPAAAELDPALAESAFGQLRGRYDAAHGGFGAAPKFPSPHNLVFLTHYWHLTGNRLALDMVERTLERMRYGGIFDHVGFGLHRYSTDREWLVPHFEKMLYDQAMLVLASSEAWQATGNPLFERTVRETVTYVLRDMTSPEGGFFSAEDADSNGEEGLFYLWALDEVQQVLGEADADFTARIWNLEQAGNYSDEATGRRTGRNIPHLTRSLRETAAVLGLEPETFETRLEGIRRRLFNAREERIHPLKDDKVLADWNGLMAAAMARAGRVFGEPKWIAAASRCVGFVDERMRDRNGRLLHRHRDGEASIPAFLDDHVFVTAAMIELYEATLDAGWLRRALDLQEVTRRLFWDDEQGGHFFAAEDNERLLIRQKEVYDGAIPSGNSTAADNAARLARLTGDRELSEHADRILASFAAEVGQHPSAHCQLLSALQRQASPSLEIVIAGDPDEVDTRALLGVVRARYLPHAAVLVVPPGKEGDGIRGIAPFAAAHEPVDGTAAAYVCRNFQCKLPVTDPEELANLLDEAVPARKP